MLVALPDRSSPLAHARASLTLMVLVSGLCSEPGCTFPEYDTAAIDLNAGAAGAAGVSPGAGAAGVSAEAGEAGVASFASCRVEPCSICEPGLADCNQLVDDGCETSLATDTDCGACGMACTNEHGTNVCVPDAATGSVHCEPSCAAGYRDCDLLPSNGCEASLNSDVMNCGACGNGCPSNGGTPVCVGGKCGVSSCNSGFGDCSNNGSCDYNLASDPLNCGQCGYVCSSAHGQARCNAGSCVTDCAAGYGDCNSDDGANDGCETRLNQPDSGGSVPNCGACGALCQRRAFTVIDLEQCAQGVCERDCMDGAHDCTNNRNDAACVGKTCGCEFDPCQ